MTTASTATASKLDPELKATATVVVLGTIMAILDTTIVTVALDTLARSFHTSLATIQWVTTAYLLAIAIVIPLSGWAIDRYGARRAWIFSISLFVVGSALCACAWSAPSLIAFRVLQGIGGGMIMPIGQAVLARAAGPARMGRVMGIVGVPTVMGPVLGPVIGGLIVTTVSWRWIFLVNVPIGIAAIYAAWKVLPRGEGHHGKALDYVGLALLSPGLFAFVYGLSEVGQNNQTFTSPKVATLLVVGVVLIGVFCLRALTAKAPLLDLRLFKVRTFTISSICIFLLGGALYGALFLLPLYYQVVRGMSPLTAGLMMAPQGLGAAMVMRYSGTLADRRGAKAVVPIGMVIMLLASLIYTQLTPHTSLYLLAISLVFRGIGMGLAMMPMVAASYSELDHASVPAASTTTNILRQVGGSVATAVLAVVLQHEVEVQTGVKSFAFSDSTAKLPPEIAGQISAAFGTSFWWAAGATAIAIIPTLFLPSKGAIDAKRQATSMAATAVAVD